MVVIQGINGDRNARARLLGLLASLVRVPITPHKRARIQRNRRVSIEYVVSILQP